MTGEGDTAPSFELPGIIGGRPGRVSLDRFLGESVVVLAFYPADFNPSCTDESTDLDEFDVFRMQSGAAVLAISGDSVYSHRQFARKHDLQLPLLADVRGEVAAAYGVDSDDPQYPNRRAVFVIDHDGIVSYRWVADDIEDRPDVESVQAAFRAVDDATLAKTQYREGHNRYAEGRDTFLEGMRAYEQDDWVYARGDFETAREELSVAADSFGRAARFSENDPTETAAERAQRTVEQLDKAIGLFADAARAHAGGGSTRGKQLHEQAETIVERVRELGPPPDPGDLPGETASPAPDTTGDELSTASDGGSAGADTGSDRPSDTDGAADIDDAELEALTAEIETQDSAENDQ